jgi:putative Mg2+ transporter-C (MgtC) family protein
LQFFNLQGTDFEILAYVAVAMLLGAIIGLEREFKEKPAGLRTHMLVAGAAALLVSLGDVVTSQFQLELGGQVVQSDPIRIIEAVITGVSFLGAGTIIRHRGKNQVEGLTTAASLLFAASLGVCIALSRAMLAVGLTLLVLVTLRGMSLARRWLEARREQH